MQHLVVDDVLHCVPRHSGMIEDAADNDRVVRRIVVPEAVSRSLAAPGDLRTRQQSVEKPDVQIVKNRFEIVDVPLWGVNLLSTAYLADQMSFARHLLARHVTAVANSMLPINRLAVHLGEENVGDGL